MPLTHLPAAQHPEVPWKNGLGVSRTIATEPAGAGYEALDWQVGGTQIGADCPFSALPGLDRLFMVTEGNGVELTSIDDEGHTRKSRVSLRQLPYAFRGDWKTDCRLLDGPVRVFNVICRRGKASATVEFLRQGEFSKGAGETVFAVDLRTLDAWRLAGAGEERAAIRLPTGPAALIRIRP